jgi:hypothetical protein
LLDPLSGSHCIRRLEGRCRSASYVCLALSAFMSTWTITLVFTCGAAYTDVRAQCPCASPISGIRIRTYPSPSSGLAPGCAHRFLTIVYVRDSERTERRLWCRTRLLLTAGQRCAPCAKSPSIKPGLRPGAQTSYPTSRLHVNTCRSGFCPSF